MFASVRNRCNRRGRDEGLENGAAASPARGLLERRRYRPPGAKARVPQPLAWRCGAIPARGDNAPSPPNAQVKLRADINHCERSELPQTARQLQPPVGRRGTRMTFAPAPAHRRLPASDHVRPRAEPVQPARARGSVSDGAAARSAHGRRHVGAAVCLARRRAWLSRVRGGAELFPCAETTHQVRPTLELSCKAARLEP